MRDYLFEIQDSYRPRRETSREGGMTYDVPVAPGEKADLEERVEGAAGAGVLRATVHFRSPRADDAGGGCEELPELHVGGTELLASGGDRRARRGRGQGAPGRGDRER